MLLILSNYAINCAVSMLKAEKAIKCIKSDNMITKSYYYNVEILNLLIEYTYSQQFYVIYRDLLKRNLGVPVSLNYPPLTKN